MKTLLTLLTVLTLALSAQASGVKAEFEDSAMTIDNTTNIVHTVAVPDDSTVRVEIVLVAVADDGTSCSYRKVGTFNNSDGLVRQVGGTATIASAEDLTECEAIIGVKGNVVTLQVAGATGKTLEWQIWGTTYMNRPD